MKARCETTKWKGISNSFTKQLNSKTTRQWVALNLCNLANRKQSEGVARTTNAVEGWHFGIQAFFSGSHPSLWRTLENLKKDAATQKYLYLQSTAGTEFSRRKKYRELEAKVKNAIERHQDENTIAFLRAMASLSMSNWTLWINYYKFCVHRAWIFKKFTSLENYKAFPSETLTQ